MARPKTIKISQGLYELVRDNEEIKEVYFTSDGSHYLSKFELDGQFYSRLGEKIEPGKGGNFGTKVKVGEKKHLIVKAVTRDEILDADFEPTPIQQEY